MKILIGIVVLVVVAVVVVANFIYERWKEKRESKAYLESSSKGGDESSESEFSSIVRVKTLLQVIGAVIEDERIDEKSDQTFLNVSYQGGYYVLTIRKELNSIRIDYYNFFECSVENYKEVQAVTNIINSGYCVWSCYYEYSQRNQEDLRNITVSMCSTFSLLGNPQRLSLMLRDHLANVFTISRSFTNEMNECVEANISPVNKEFVNDRLFNDKISYIQNLYLKGLIDKNIDKLPDVQDFSLYNIIMSYKLLDLGNVQGLRIVCDDEVELLLDRDKIINFDVRDYIISKPNARELNNLVFTFSFEERSVTFVMSKHRSSTKNSLFFNTYLVGITSEEESNGTFAAQKPILLEVRFANAEQDFQEAKFMIAEAFEKRDRVGAEELSDMDSLIVATAEPNLQADLYWAKKFYNNECYYQSLFYFKRVYNNLNNKSLSDDTKNLLYKVCYYMSVIYLQLSLYYEAKYFAYIANEMNSIPPRMIWVSAISRLDNPLLLAVLQNELNHIQEMLNKEKVSETLLQYRGFLIREYVLCNKKQGRYDESIDILKQMIENNDDIDFAKSELKEIYKLRKIQNNQTNNQ
jgi:hypothetical protein